MDLRTLTPHIAYVSMKRIDEFLAESEVEDWASSLKSTPINRPERQVKIGFENASFEWDVAPKSEPSRFSLGPLNVEFPIGKLTIVSGATGSGKSALLAALLGGMSDMYLISRFCVVTDSFRNAFFVWKSAFRQGWSSGRVLCTEPLYVLRSIAI